MPIGKLRVENIVMAYTKTKDVINKFIKQSTGKVTSVQDYKRNSTILTMDHPDFTDSHSNGEYQLWLNKKGDDIDRLDYYDGYNYTLVKKYGPDFEAMPKKVQNKHSVVNRAQE